MKLARLNYPANILKLRHVDFELAHELVARRLPVPPDQALSALVMCGWQVGIRHAGLLLLLAGGNLAKGNRGEPVDHAQLDPLDLRNLRRVSEGILHVDPQP